MVELMAKGHVKSAREGCGECQGVFGDLNGMDAAGIAYCDVAVGDFWDQGFVHAGTCGLNPFEIGCSTDNFRRKISKYNFGICDSFNDILVICHDNVGIGSRVSNLLAKVFINGGV